MNPDYKSIEKLVLANNSISSLRGFETSWLYKTGPTLLDLRHNNIREVWTTQYTDENNIYVKMIYFYSSVGHCSAGVHVVQS